MRLVDAWNAFAEPLGVRVVGMAETRLATPPRATASGFQYIGAMDGLSTMACARVSIGRPPGAA